MHTYHTLMRKPVEFIEEMVEYQSVVWQGRKGDFTSRQRHKYKKVLVVALCRYSLSILKNTSVLSDGRVIPMQWRR